MVFKILQEKKYQHYTHAHCPNCNEVSTVDNWNDIAIKTYGETSPDIRMAALEKTSFPYQCPKCYMAYSAHLLTFEKIK
ncbi:hypothetical protein [Bacillus alkalicola]|uniref:CpXC domain-containing protein n=1 Tax=Evansella alkalicola TaxID=745819 RepID=A0ABS6JSM8_9BACI|nr:hypothetical protein [Bacillus alkalicola]MBU9721571.1 CpXC domain-containing protein [Bacillus alkalicola]